MEVHIRVVRIFPANSGHTQSPLLPPHTLLTSSSITLLPVASFPANLLSPPLKSKHWTWGGIAFPTAAPSYWNSLHSHIQGCADTSKYKSQLKTHLLNKLLFRDDVVSLHVDCISGLCSCVFNFCTVSLSFIKHLKIKWNYLFSYLLLLLLLSFRPDYCCWPRPFI